MTEVLSKLRGTLTEELLRTLVVLVFFVTVSYITILTQVYTTRHSPLQDTLPDIGYDIIPLISSYSVPDIAVGVVVVTFFIWALLHPFRGLIAMRRLGLLLGVCYLIRIFSIASTILPDPDQRCMENAEGYQSGLFLVPFRYVLGTATLCSDLVFSGHTCTATLVLLIVASSDRSRVFAFRLLTIFILLVEYVALVICIIGARFHYSVDVYIGAVISLCVFIIYKLALTLGSITGHFRLLRWVDGDPQYATEDSLKDKLGFVIPKVEESPPGISGILSTHSPVENSPSDVTECASEYRAGCRLETVPSDVNSPRQFADPPDLQDITEGDIAALSPALDKA
ncbi:PAP2 superfamily C-terminal [Carpediemonas membranifera]|uniref:PAP2 superfamily C-terminal n=1 Tax=Carpediemonas membranifera TaxID=201153 RepID=A0A8J6B597_9EUKA|nr:PAP2 superfamily C-terminal [Carpediemonas membranifera]|eukprot:KAG9393314.1 PAP2 superfamily C-terminal [Carpediemonas membranifera]